MVAWLSLAEGAPAPPPTVRVGVSLSVTGPEARRGVPLLRGVELAMEDVNRRGGAGGRPLEIVLLDSAMPGLDTVAWQHAVAAQYRQFIADPTLVAVLGPQTSLGARAVAAQLSRSGLATVTPSATTFDITDPALGTTFRPGGGKTYFRTIGTDLTQADAMARFAHAKLGVRRVVLIDDGLGFGVRMVDIFGERAAALGIAVLERWQLNWVAQDYRAGLRRLAERRPDAVYVGVRYGVGVKLARQVPDLFPNVRVLAPETVYNQAFPLQAGPSMAEGWYVSSVGPDPSANPAAAGWVARFRDRFGAAPTSGSLTAYTAVMVIADAASRAAQGGRAVTRRSVREAIEATRLPDALSGPVAFDPNGDLERPAVSIYQVRRGAFYHAETALSPSVKRGVRR